MEMELNAPTNDVIAMNLTLAALDQWLKNAAQERNGAELGREIGAMYREIHAAVDEMSPDDDDFNFDDDDEDEEEKEEEEEDDGEDDDEDEEERD